MIIVMLVTAAAEVEVTVVAVANEVAEVVK